MNKEELIKKTTLLSNKIKMKTIKHSPEIFMTAGVIGIVASTVLACKATLKVNEIMEEKNDTLFNINKCYKDETINYTEKDKNKDTTLIYLQTGVKLAKIYAPSIALGTLSIASIVNGHNILKKRNVALAAAYTVVDKGFKDYRKNVVERFGDQVDKELRYNIKAEEIEKTITDKNGKKKKTKEMRYKINGNPTEIISEFAKFFDESTSDQYRKDAEYNLTFLRRQQDYANEILKNRGYLFLNEVYEMLGIQKTKAGQIVGWVYNEKNPSGDNYVDFGIYQMTGVEIYDERKRAFVNGQERSILLDFNVDGNILDLI